MDVSGGLGLGLGAGTAGIPLLLCLEGLLTPRPSFKRPVRAWTLEISLWLCLYSLLLFLLARPWCALGGALAFIFILVLVNNAKYKSLREPFLFHDYDYFLDTLRFPRLFLPFLGVKSFLIAAAGCLFALGCFFMEKAPAPRFSLEGQSGACLLYGALGLCGLYFGSRRMKASFDPMRDYMGCGFLPCLFLYCMESRALPDAISPFKASARKGRKNLPHLVALQSESCFDARKLGMPVNPELWSNFDRFRDEAQLAGELLTPAWGANTVRAEAAFLTGIAPEALGAHKFNPYQAMLRGWMPDSLPGYLKSLGYEVVCIHPYHRAFYGRNRIFPRLGFDQFIDGNAFGPADRAGPYVGDRALGAKILEILKAARKPVFIFAISMENHGPLHLEPPLAPERKEAIFGTRGDSPDDLALYLNHFCHTDQMLGELWGQFSACPPLAFCFYGDHVPILPQAYNRLGDPDGNVPYFCWGNYGGTGHERLTLQASALGLAWLDMAGLLPPRA